MKKYSLSFLNQSLENDYFNKVALPHYDQIFSTWCKILIVMSVPCLLFTYFTNNPQYLGFIWCIISSTIALFLVRQKKSAFNLIVAVYNIGFVVLNVGFITMTDKNIGANGQSNNMMFIFAGSQYVFHFILSIGSNFLLTSFVIFVQNFSYSAVFFPGALNSFHGLLFFSMCFLIWMKYTNEKHQREVFLLQEKEKEWSLFVRDVLPSSVIMVKYDQTADQIQNKLINRTAQADYNISDNASLTQFLRNTVLSREQKDDKLLVNSIITRASVFKNIIPKNQKVPYLNVGSDTLENFIYYRFKSMLTKKSTVPSPIIQEQKKENNINIINESLSISKSANYQKDLKRNSIYFEAFTSPMNQQSQFAQESQLNSCQNVMIAKQKQDKSNKFPIQKIPEIKSETNEPVDLYKVEEFKAQILKNNIQVDVIVKIVFFHLSCPVCSISIDEGLKQQVQNISKQSQQKENIYFQHFQKITQKFKKIISITNIKLLQPYNLLHLNHLQNFQDFILLKSEKRLNINYTKFELTNLLKYISSIFSLKLKSEEINFNIQICHEYPIKQNQVPQKKGEEINLTLEQEKKQVTYVNAENDKMSAFPLKKSILELDEENSGTKVCTQYVKYEELKNYTSSIPIFNDQQRICQVIINLIENASEYLKTSPHSPKQIQLFVKVIHGCEDHSNLIQFKVVNSVEANYSKDNIYLIIDSLKFEREINNPNFMWQTQTSFHPTQLGLKLNQKILEKISPFNYMNFTCGSDSIEISFLTYSDCDILLSATDKKFSNKRFEIIRKTQLKINSLQSQIIQDSLLTSCKVASLQENNEHEIQSNQKVDSTDLAIENNSLQCISQVLCGEEQMNENKNQIHEFQSKHINFLNCPQNILNQSD